MNNLIHNNLMSQKSETELKLVSLYCVSNLALSDCYNPDSGLNQS